MDVRRLPARLVGLLAVVLLVAAPAIPVSAQSRQALIMHSGWRGAMDAGAPAWLTMPALGAPRYNLSVAAAGNGRIYAIGGYNHSLTVESYAPGDQIWRAERDMPANCIAKAAVTGKDGSIYGVACGVGDTLEVYHPATNTWTTRAKLPDQRADLAAAVDGAGRIYAIAGRSVAAGGATVGTVSVYVPAKNTWTSAPSLRTPRANLAACAAGGRIYAIGGHDASNVILDSVESYKPGGKSWTYVAPMPEARYLIACATGSDGRIYVIGGINSAMRTTNGVLAYTPATNTWTTAASLSTARCCLGAALGPDGRIYAVGGFTTAATGLVEAYGPAIAVQPTSGQPGSAATLSGANFAPNATVSIYWGTVHTTTLLATGATNSQGALPNPVKFTVPGTATKGAYRVIALDALSRYPVSATFTVAP